MIPIHIRPATKSDAAAISRIHYEAQDQYNGFYAAVLTEHPRDFLVPLTTLAMEYTTSVFLVATCATTVGVLGFIRYSIVDPSAAALLEPKTKSEHQLSLEARRPKPKLHLAELWKRFENPREEEKEACYANVHQGRRHTCTFHSISTCHLHFPVSFALNTRESRYQPPHDLPPSPATRYRQIAALSRHHAE
jgi:hypothetical protein